MFLPCREAELPVWGYNGWVVQHRQPRPTVCLAPICRANSGDLSACGDSTWCGRGVGSYPGGTRQVRSDKALQQAIRHAETGFPVAPRVAADWANFAEKLMPHTGSVKHFLIDGKAPEVGHVMRQPALALTLKKIAAAGAKAFYEGQVAADIAATVQAAGGLLTVEDLASHHGDVVEPISTSYHGLEIVQLPPNGQGVTALLLLNILEQLDLKSLDPMGAQRLHLALEAARLAFGVRDMHLADADHMSERVAALLDKDFAQSLAKLLDPGKRVPLPKSPVPSRDTTYLTVVDRDRMAVSLINSLYSGFGTGICTENTGVMLHNRGTGFVIEPGHPNTIAPGKRPMHTLMPALAMRDGRCTTSFGVMGADFQPMGQAHVITNIVDYDMDIQQAIDAPRAFYMDEITEVERGCRKNDRRTEVAGARGGVSPAATWRRTGHCHRLGQR